MSDATVPPPLTGDGKTLLRVHDGRMLTATPVSLPADDAIGAEQADALLDAGRPTG